MSHDPSRKPFKTACFCCSAFSANSPGQSHKFLSHCTELQKEYPNQKIGLAQKRRAFH